MLLGRAARAVAGPRPCILRGSREGRERLRMTGRGGGGGQGTSGRGGMGHIGTPVRRRAASGPIIAVSRLVILRRSRSEPRRMLLGRAARAVAGPRPCILRGSREGRERLRMTGRGGGGGQGTSGRGGMGHIGTPVRRRAAS